MEPEVKQEEVKPVEQTQEERDQSPEVQTEIARVAAIPPSQSTNRPPAIA